MLSRLVVLMNELTCPVQRFCEEVVTLEALHHRNVLPLLGVMMAENPCQLVMASEWMKNGNINMFVRARLDVDRLKLVRFLFRVLIPPDFEVFVIVAACRRQPGIDLYA